MMVYYYCNNIIAQLFFFFNLNFGVFSPREEHNTYVSKHTNIFFFFLTFKRLLTGFYNDMTSDRNIFSSSVDSVRGALHLDDAPNIYNTRLIARKS